MTTEPTPDAPGLPELPASAGYLFLHNTGGVSQVHGYTAHQMREMYQRGLSARPLPSDWVAVPREPTDDMEVAFAEQWFTKVRPIDDVDLSDCYRAMIEAAPSAPAEKGEKRVWQCPTCPTSVEYDGKLPPPCPRCDASMALDPTAKTAPEPLAQGEIVGWQYRVTAGPQTGWSLWMYGRGDEFEANYTVERRPLYTDPQTVAEPSGKLVGWWNGITEPEFSSVAWGSKEDRGHDIPLYDGYNPIHYAPRVIPDPKPYPDTMLATWHEAKGWNACRDAMTAYASPQQAAEVAPKYTAGHCANHNQPGGCQLHNLQCGWPSCDRKAVQE